MASFPETPILEIYHGHKREQSQDSGAYIDWNSEDSASPTGNVDAKGEFVTVVAVESNGGAGENSQQSSSFVTVLEINDEDGKAEANEDVLEEVLVYRLPGERLGFGLKFEGGTNTAENVKRLFIQSSAPDSPASRAECSWGSLVEGDEIIKIDGHEVKEMTRLDCVRCLKESSVVIKLYVRHPNRVEKSDKSSTSPLVISAEMKKKVPPPPPIPPRKIPRKAPQREEVPMVGPPEAFCDVPVPKTRNLSAAPDDPAKNQSKSSVFVPAKEVADASKRMPKRNGFDLKHIPPEPEVYLDILAQEDMKNNCESESDDTGSTISTVMGFSATNSSFDLRSNTDSTTPSTPTSTPSTPVLDVAKMMHQNSESDFLFTKMINDKGHDTVGYDEKSSVCSDDNAPLQPPLSFQDAPLSYGNEEIKVSLTEAVEDSLKNLSEETPEEGELTKSKAGNGKKTSLIPRLAKSIGLITSPPKPSPRKETEKSRSKKRPPPPPPPPPRQPETETKTLKSSIPYLKKKKAKNEKKSKSSNKPETIENDVEESEFPPDQDNPTLSWPVPELKNLRQQIETCVDGDSSAEESLGTDPFLPGSSDADFAVDAARDPYFLQWGSSKHLETIGEDEEDGCSEDMPGGQKAEEKEEAKNEGQKPESPENDEESAEGDGATAEKETDAKPEAAEEKTEEEEKKLGGEGRKKSFRATFGGGLFLGVRFLTYGFVLAHFT
ncbi:UNVERIFIED_CONTAM: hypothetical protein PYX00_000056 [Menopon gallinae]|uniref:PDZ domain-containing protein n=1 Tax=Menopon gallinae TaxID=328185 RepID=A0AAW2I8V2_9NEOP